MSRLILGSSALVGMVACAAPAMAQRTQIRPYIEATQVVMAELPGGDVLTYSTIGAGVDASVQTRRVEVQLNYKYERRFDYQRALDRQDMHSGLFRGKAVLVRGLNLEGGAIATQTRSDFRGDALLTDKGNIRNAAQLFSGYIGPNLSTNVGPVQTNAAYRFGYSKVGASTTTGVAPGLPLLDSYDNSTVHVATASMGVKAGTVLPIGLTASGSYTRENAGQLDQRFEGKYARVDAVLPVTREVALVGGVGYENIQVSQRDPLLDGAGDVVRDRNNRFVTDPNSPRRIAYDLDGLFWDVGVMWRPSRRTTVEARVGRRYESMSYTGSLNYQFGANSGIQINVYDSVQTFGQQLNGTLATLPTSFISAGSSSGNPYGGCISGTSGSAPGNCMNGALSSAATSAYRARGISGNAMLGRGDTRYGVGGGYSRRTFLTPNGAPGISINGSTDETIYAQVFASTLVGPNGSLSANAFASYYTTDLAPDSVIGWGANTAYTHRFGPLGATVSAGLFGSDNQNNGANTVAQVLFGLRYGF